MIPPHRLDYLFLFGTVGTQTYNPTLGSRTFQAWRQHHSHLQGGDQSNPAYRQGFSGGEMAALGVVAGQAAAALRRLGVEEADRKGALQKLDEAAAGRVDEMQVKGTRW